MTALSEAETMPDSGSCATVGCQVLWQSASDLSTGGIVVNDRDRSTHGARWTVAGCPSWFA
jgi:hypothetical protein